MLIMLNLLKNAGVIGVLEILQSKQLGTNSTQMRQRTLSVLERLLCFFLTSQFHTLCNYYLDSHRDRFILLDLLTFWCIYFLFFVEV